MTTPTITEADVLAAKRATLNLAEITDLLNDESAKEAIKRDIAALMKIIRHADASLKN